MRDARHTGSQSQRPHVTALALAVVCMFAQAAHGSPTPQQLQSVKAYANVPIAEDTVNSWGPWTEFESPAAGPTAPLLQARQFQAPDFRVTPVVPDPPVEPPVEPPIDPLNGVCAGGGLCGFGLFGAPGDLSSPKQIGAQALAGDSTLEADQFPYMMTGAEVTGASGEAGVIGALPQALSLSTTALAGGSLLQPASGDLALNAVALGDPASPFAYLIGYGRSAPIDTAGSQVRLESLLETWDLDRAASEQLAWVAMDVAVWSYVSGADSDGPTFSGQSQGHYGILGRATPDAVMESLRGTGTANYSGYSAGGIFSNVDIQVNFNGTTPTWSGRWNNGADSGVIVRSTPTGSVVLGNVGFIASGTVTGANFLSTSISATDGTIGAGSFVKGAFFGPTASAVGGVTQIIKSRPATDGAPGYTNQTARGVFVASRVEAR